jgi:hypothetical protein
VTQFKKKRALSVPKNTVHHSRRAENVLRERDGEASSKPSILVAVDLVEAARSWGGQPFVLSRTKLSHYPIWVLG